MLYPKDYILVPKRVWKGLSAWYGQSIPLMRKVINYETENVRDLDSTASCLRLTKENRVYEVEVDEVYLKFGQVTESKDSLDETKTRLQEASLSRKTRLIDVLSLLADKFSQ